MSKKLNDFERQNRKQMQNIQYKEIPHSYITKAPEFETIEHDDRKELCLISQEMAYVLIYRVINELSDIEKIIIRHQFGLPKVYERGQYYTVKNRVELAQQLKDHPYFKEVRKLNHLDPIRKEIKHIREEALKKLFQHLWFSESYVKEWQELSEV